jgi:hypothetical protein
LSEEWWWFEVFSIEKLGVRFEAAVTDGLQSLQYADQRGMRSCEW